LEQQINTSISDSKINELEKQISNLREIILGASDSGIIDAEVIDDKKGKK
jgi:hypothetical protein